MQGSISPIALPDNLASLVSNIAGSRRLLLQQGLGHAGPLHYLFKDTSPLLASLISGEWGGYELSFVHKQPLQPQAVTLTLTLSLTLTFPISCVSPQSSVVSFIFSLRFLLLYSAGPEALGQAMEQAAAALLMRRRQLGDQSAVHLQAPSMHGVARGAAGGRYCAAEDEDGLQLADGVSLRAVKALGDDAPQGGQSGAAWCAHWAEIASTSVRAFHEVGL